MEAWNQFDAWQRNFDGYEAVGWAREHAEIPVFCVAAYLLVVFYVPVLMESRKPFSLRWLFTLWNLFLAVFSIIGAYYVVPVFVARVASHGYRSTICDDPNTWHLNGAVGAWMVFFILSKIPELFDTAFLVLQKKPVIFLHWYHHTTVMLYCWHAWINLIPTGIWFCAMNYTVHAIMYSYYFMMSLSAPTRKMVKPFAKMITTLQLSQMVVGVVVTVSVTVFHHAPEPCIVSPANNKMALAMYASYFVLFANLFHRNYISKAKKSPAAQVCTSAEDSIGSTCTADQDAAEHVASADESNKAAKKAKAEKKADAKKRK